MHACTHIYIHIYIICTWIHRHVFRRIPVKRIYVKRLCLCLCLHVLVTPRLDWWWWWWLCWWSWWWWWEWWCSLIYGYDVVVFIFIYKCGIYCDDGALWAAACTRNRGFGLVGALKRRGWNGRSRNHEEARIGFRVSGKGRAMKMNEKCWQLFSEP